MGQIAVTVIIPNYNQAMHLENCLNSLLASIKISFDILVVDNGSTDQSAELVLSKYPTVQLMRLPNNTGFAHAVNEGIRAAKTPYVILLNNDTIVAPDFVYAMTRAIKRKPCIFSVAAKMIQKNQPNLLDGTGDYYCALGYAFSRGKDEPTTRYNKPTPIFSACGGAAIYNRQLLQEIGLFEETFFAYLEDVDIGYRARIHGYENIYEPRAKVWHIGSAHSGSRYNQFKTPLVAANSIRLILRNMPPPQLLLNLPFLLAGFAVKTVFYHKHGMATLYLKGLFKGFTESIGSAYATNKPPALKTHFKQYVRIQLELYKNVFRILIINRNK
jgi:GT2 family glycosyltransferase